MSTSDNLRTRQKLNLARTLYLTPRQVACDRHCVAHDAASIHDISEVNLRGPDPADTSGLRGPISPTPEPSRGVCGSDPHAAFLDCFGAVMTDAYCIWRPVTVGTRIVPRDPGEDTRMSHPDVSPSHDDPTRVSELVFHVRTTVFCNF